MENIIKCSHPKMTGKTRVWPVKSTIRPDIVRWPAVILSPAQIFPRWLDITNSVNARISAQLQLSAPLRISAPLKAQERKWVSVLGTIYDTHTVYTVFLYVTLLNSINSNVLSKSHGFASHSYFIECRRCSSYDNIAWGQRYRNWSWLRIQMLRRDTIF